MTGFNHVNKRKRIVAAVIGAVVLPLVLAGCWNGFGAQTSIQPPSGDGLATQVGNIQIRNAVWVQDSKEKNVYTLSATFVNTGKTEDALTAVSTDPKAFGIGITDGAIQLEPISETRTAYNSDKYINGFGINVQESAYVQTTFTFKNAGSVTGSIMTVPPTGIYEGIQPTLPPQVRPSASASPLPSARVPQSAAASPSN